MESLLLYTVYTFNSEFVTFNKPLLSKLPMTLTRITNQERKGTLCMIPWEKKNVLAGCSVYFVACWKHCFIPSFSYTHNLPQVRNKRTYKVYHVQWLTRQLHGQIPGDLLPNRLFSLCCYKYFMMRGFDLAFYLANIAVKMGGGVCSSSIDQSPQSLFSLKPLLGGHDVWGERKMQKQSTVSKICCEAAFSFKENSIEI